jgi:hypothetical protein
VHEVQLCVPLFYISLHIVLLHVHCHLFFIFHYTQSCTSCTLSLLFYASLHRGVLHVRGHPFLIFHYNVHEVQLCVVKHLKRGDNVHEVQLCVVKYKKRWQCTWSTAVCSETLKMFHYTQLYFMYIVTFVLYFTTHSCTSCTLSPLFLCFTTHRALLRVHCHLFFYISLQTAVLHVDCCV